MFDAAYLHVMIFSTQAYFDLLSGHQSRSTRETAAVHFSKTLRLLQNRLSAGDEQVMISDSTVLVVLALAGLAHVMGEHESAKNHMEGLRKLVVLRGGTTGFKNNVKLLIAIIR